MTRKINYNMNKKNIPYKLFIYMLCIISIIACSTTKNLPKNEILYTGIGKIAVEHQDKTPTGSSTLDEVEAALAYPPNNAFFGSSSIRTPIPMGLWAYNAFVKSEKGLGKWFFNHMAATPVYISTVNPETRVKIAQNVLHNYGYFNGEVSYQIKKKNKDSRTAKIDYLVNMMNPYIIDSIEYPGYPIFADSLIRASIEEKQLIKGHNFSVVDLDAERNRLSTLFRNNGCFLFRPDYLTYKADTLRKPGQVSLRLVPQKNIPSNAMKQWYIGNTCISLQKNRRDSLANKDIREKDRCIRFSGNKSPVRTNVLARNILFNKGELFSQAKIDESNDMMNRLGIFSNLEYNLLPRDTTQTCDTLDIEMNAVLDKPIDGEIEANFKSKSNDQMGPGISVGFSKKNFFRGGETFSVKLNGSYEWQTGNTVGDQSHDMLNSYEMGLTTSLTFPKILLPGKKYTLYKMPASTQIKLGADQLNRASLFKLLKLSGSITYDFQPTATTKHSISPFSLTYTLLQSHTAKFDSITEKNPALYVSLRNQFIPAASYTFTYDNTAIANKNIYTWWQSSITSSGNLLSGINAVLGHSWNEKGKKLLWNEYAQFLKFTSELRNTFQITKKSQIATRIMAGAIFSYGNSSTAPYSEQFFIGGANSIRAFTIRSIGPGHYHPASGEYTYLDQTGDLKFEANAEYRFNIAGNLYGATFLDCGNVWLMKTDENREGSKFESSRFFKDLALGTGAGLRYDMEFLVLRLDMGIALHVPYETGKGGYYNIPNFKDGIGIHLAVGYPF